MILNELWDKEPNAYQDLEQDNSQTRLGDLRKTKLTLRQIKKLRLIKDIQRVERAEKLKYVQLQYAPPAEPAM